MIRLATTCPRDVSIWKVDVPKEFCCPIVAIAAISNPQPKRSSFVTTSITSIHSTVIKLWYNGSIFVLYNHVVDPVVGHVMANANNS